MYVYHCLFFRLGRLSCFLFFFLPFYLSLSCIIIRFISFSLSSFTTYPDKFLVGVGNLLLFVYLIYSCVHCFILRQ